MATNQLLNVFDKNEIFIINYFFFMKFIKFFQIEIYDTKEQTNKKRLKVLGYYWPSVIIINVIIIVSTISIITSKI